ncbi:MAG: efflux RND transporter periplasmic adaptor subunit [Hyphomicrobium sp.]|nr:efflux RND transporter periplasmic adaptor subunit [Hyphomicrobium sp.]
MRPRYVLLTLVLAAAVVIVALGPLSGKSVQEGISGLGDNARSAIATLFNFGPSASKSNGPTPPPAPELTISQPIARDVIEWDEYLGRFDAVEEVEMQARVSGHLTNVNFTDGQIVNAGELLFTIDPRPFERALEQAKAQLDQTKVQVSNAALDVNRGRPLLKRETISRKTFDDRENLVREAEAAVKVAEARVNTAELELSFTRVLAPISGRIGRALVTPGNFISGGGTDSGSTILATIVTQGPIYIYFDVSENNALKYQRLAGASSNDGSGLVGAAVGVGLPDEEGFPHDGKLDFLDNRLDVDTGTLRARAVVPNATGLLSPGMFARVRLQGSPEYEAVLLPDEAIGTDQTSRYVWVVGADDVPVRKTVKLGPIIDGLRVVREGVEPDDWVAIKGQQRIRPHMKIVPKKTPLQVSQATGKGKADSAKKP